MKKISLLTFLILMLNAHSSAAKMGDVYSCVSKQFVTLTPSFVQKNQTTQRFTFKRTENGLIFDRGDHHLTGISFPERVDDIPFVENFRWKGAYTSFEHGTDGVFAYVFRSTFTISAMMGNCKILDYN
jgi:hypothetical protein